MQAPDKILKDPSVVYDNGWFYVFTNQNYRTRNFITYELLGRTGSQPDVTWSGHDWVMAKNGGRLPGWTQSGSAAPRFMRSADLLQWGPTAELLPGLTEERNIDPALAWEGGFVFIGFKRDQAFRVTRTRPQDLGTALYAPHRAANAGGRWAEQFQFRKINGVWHMFATGRRYGLWDLANLALHPYTGNHHSFIYRRAGQGTDLASWTNWVDRRELNVPVENWNTAMHANGPYLLDHRGNDGYFYLFYAGSTDHDSFNQRGHGKIGVVRSRDLITWVVPGDMSH